MSLVSQGEDDDTRLAILLDEGSCLGLPSEPFDPWARNHQILCSDLNLQCYLNPWQHCCRTHIVGIRRCCLARPDLTSNSKMSVVDQLCLWSVSALGLWLLRNPTATQSSFIAVLTSVLLLRRLAVSSLAFRHGRPLAAFDHHRAAMWSWLGRRWSSETWRFLGQMAFATLRQNSVVVDDHVSRVQCSSHGVFLVVETSHQRRRHQRCVFERSGLGSDWNCWGTHRRKSKISACLAVASLPIFPFWLSNMSSAGHELARMMSSDKCTGHSWFLQCSQAFILGTSSALRESQARSRHWKWVMSCGASRGRQ